MIPRRKRQKGKKVNAQRQHAKHRFCERVGIELTPDLEAQLIAHIQKGKSTIVDTQSKRVTVHEVTLAGLKPLKLVYDKQRKVIVTVLPDNAYSVNDTGAA